MPLETVYDSETYPNLFSVAMTPFALEDDREWDYAICEHRNDAMHLAYDLRNGSITRMFGFNNLSFDYPLLHYFMWAIDAGYENPMQLAQMMFDKAQKLIAEQHPWMNRVKPWEVTIPQVDVFLINHFDNRAKQTSLKVLEFNMQSPSLEELPFPVGTWLSREQIDVVLRYGRNDTREQKRFTHKCIDAIKFREDVIASGMLGADAINYNDTKIGKEYFKRELERRSPGLTKYKDGCKPQTWRARIRLADVIFPWIRYDRPDLQALHQQLMGIEFAGHETKNAYKIPVNIDGFEFDVGQGGIHGSVEKRIVRADASHAIVDIDVTGYYPRLATVHRIFPAHLGPVFCDVYRDISDERERAKNAGQVVKAGTLKLANNGTFGDMGAKHSVFYDPQAMIAVTINGQLLQVLLVEALLRIPGLEVIQMNTDGLTVRVPRGLLSAMRMTCDWWMYGTGLSLEFGEYDAMWARDCNNYLALFSKDAANGKKAGTVKRKGAYDWEMLSGSTGGQKAWNRDFSGLVIAKAAEAAFLHDHDPADFIEHHAEPYDFMMRKRVDGADRMFLGDGTPLPRTVRYFVSTDGQPIYKIMPPLPGKTEPRRTGIHAVGQADCTGGRNEYKCSACDGVFRTKAEFHKHNKVMHPWMVSVRNHWNAAAPDMRGLNLDYYVQAAEKLLF